MRSAFGLSLLVGLLTSLASAEPVWYDLGKNGENKTNITWESRASIERIIGHSTQCEGIVRWDPDNLDNCFIECKVPVESIRTGIAQRDEHLRSGEWLDAAKYPYITFRTRRIRPVEGEKHTYKLIGDFTCKGVTRRRTITATITPLPARKGLEDYGYVGDIIHIQARFDVVLKAHNIDVPKNLLGLKVAPKVTVDVDIFGFTNNRPHREEEEGTSPGPTTGSDDDSNEG